MNNANNLVLASTFFKKNKALLSFFVKGLLIYFVLSWCFYGYVGLVDAKGGFYSPFLAKYSLLQLILDCIIYPSEFILNLTGYDTIKNSNTIWFANGPGVLIEFPCMGVGMMITWLALLAAYPTGKKRILFIGLGILTIHILNVTRILALLFIQKSYKHIDISHHHDIFNYIVYTLIFIMFYFWLKYSENPNDSIKS